MIWYQNELYKRMYITKTVKRSLSSCIVKSVGSNRKNGLDYYIHITDNTLYMFV